MISEDVGVSVISNKAIIKKAGSGSKVKITGEDGFYNILYKTTSLIDGMVYVGAHKTKKNPEKDSYLGNGITANKNHNTFNADLVCIGSHFEKYGRANFKREDLLYFKTYSEAKKAEGIVVDIQFIQHPSTLNLCLGGGNPPVLFGKENGNYGNLWSKKQKEELSNHFKLTRDYRGDKNPNSKCVVLIDCWSDNYDKEFITSFVEAEERFNYCKTTVSVMLARYGYMIIDFRYLLVTEKEYNKLSKGKLKELVDAAFTKRSKRHLMILMIKRGIIKNDWKQLSVGFPSVSKEVIQTIIEFCKSTI